MFVNFSYIGLLSSKNVLPPKLTELLMTMEMDLMVAFIAGVSGLRAVTECAVMHSIRTQSEGADLRSSSSWSSVSLEDVAVPSQN